MKETCKQCSTTGSCPFAYTDESEQAQNYGCLPTPLEIIIMKAIYNKTWACHSNPDKPCLGALERLKQLGYDTKVEGKLLTLDDDFSQYNNLTDKQRKKFYKDYNNRDINYLINKYESK